MIKPVTVSVEVPQPIDDVFDYLDVLANHRAFTDHILEDWELFGPAAGVGSGTRVVVRAGGRTDHVTIEVTAAERPHRIVERNVGAGGARVGTGTYELASVAGGGTLIKFTYAWESAPMSERIAAPLVRRILRRGNETAMRRLAEQLAARPAAAAEAAHEESPAGA